MAPSTVLFSVLVALAVAESDTGTTSPDDEGVCLMQLATKRKYATKDQDKTAEDTPPLDAVAAFSDYVSSFRRDYHGSPEWDERQALFAERLSLIQTHNANPARLWTAGVNKLTDRTEQELKQLRGYRKGKMAQSGGTILLAKSAQTHKQPAAEVDWRNLGMAMPVPDQGGCGSCWAVATKSMLDGRYEVQKRENRSFSAQQLVNCVPNPRECGGSGGCEGATVELAMQYVQDAGLEVESDVPYKGITMDCEYPMSSDAQSKSSLMVAELSMPRSGASKLGLRSWQTLPENMAHPLMLAVADGPVAISVAASPWVIYHGGIFNGCHKDTVVDHAVTLFGYGSANGVNYWTIRNSWGSEWGESGFIRMFRHDTVEEDDAWCGEDKDPGMGLACKPYPEKVTVCGMCGMLYDSVAASFK